MAFGIQSLKKLKADIILPEHIGIIMDGNGRWAKSAVCLVLSDIVRVQNFQKNHKILLGHRYKISYRLCFSTENWKRPEDEVSALMKLLSLTLTRRLRTSKMTALL